MGQDPKTHALTMYASIYVHISRMTNYYSEAKATAKKILHENIDEICRALLHGKGEQHNGKLITFYNQVREHVDEI